MIAADNAPSVGARCLLRLEVIGRIDLEAVGLVRKIARGVQCRNAEHRAIPRAFEETATFTRKSSVRSAADRGGERRRQFNAPGQMSS